MFKKISITLIVVLFNLLNTYSQVGIGTTNPDDGSSLQIDSTTGAFVPPRMTTEQMNSISTPLDGALVFNTTLNSYCVFKNNNWSSLNNSSIILNKSYSNGNNALQTPDNTYVDFPIGSDDVIATNPNAYEVIGDGRVKIKEEGNYLFSASLSTSNMPSGNKKYILAININGSLVAYLSRGYSSLPSTNYWGTSGNIMYPVSENDIVTFRYVLNNEDSPLHAKFINFGITKLN